MPKPTKKQGERWITIPDFPDYELSMLGRVRRKPYDMVYTKVVKKPARVLVTTNRKVSFRQNGTNYHRSIDQMLIEYWDLFTNT